MFIAHLVNQRVADEMIALQILVHLLEQPTDDSVEIAVGFAREAGAFLDENSGKVTDRIYGYFRNILLESSGINKRVQYMVEVLFQVRKDKFKDNPILPEGLDLVQEDDQITHGIALDDELQVQESLSMYLAHTRRLLLAIDGPILPILLDVFKFDPDFLEHEAKYREMKAEILGDDEEDGSDGSSETEDEDGEEATGGKLVPPFRTMDQYSSHPTEVAGIDGIQDRTETNLVNLRRVIYLTIMNSLTYEEAVHKLMKVNIQEGQEVR